MTRREAGHLLAWSLLLGVCLSLLLFGMPA